MLILIFFCIFAVQTLFNKIMDKRFFCQCNINPSSKPGKRWIKGDCVVRAFALAANITWLEAFDLLVERARKKFDVPSSMSNYPYVLVDYGFKKRSVSVLKGQKRLTLEDFCKSHPQGRFCVKVSNHLTSVIDGVCYDVWYPGNKCVYVYYEFSL